jgi:oligoendopeptidase F
MLRGLVLAAVIALALGAISTSHAAGFQAIPENQKDLYRFDLERNFYADEAAFDADLAILTGMIGEIERLKGRVAESAGNLYRAYELNEQTIPVWYKLWVYANLRYSVNTEDIALFEKIQRISGDLDSRIQFIKTETQAIDDAALARMFREKPELATYAFAIETTRRYRPHTMALAEEELLASLDPYLNTWAEKLYQVCLDRTDFPDIPVDGETLDVNLNYSALINLNDRAVRKEAWEGYFHSMATHRDIYAFALTKGMETRDKIAVLRRYSSFPDAKFFDIFLSYEDVSAFFGEIAAHAGLRKNYERIRQARIKATTGYDTVYVWDRQTQAEDFVKPRFEIGEASDVIKQATARFGEEYQRALAYLLNPANGRLDIVGGPRRSPGMFSTGYPGAPHQFFSQTYNGYLNEITGLAHESGHAIHHAMQTEAGMRPIYSDGPRYITEAIAMTNELLVSHSLYANEKDLKRKAYYLEQFLENTLGLLTNNMYADLELKMYEGLENGTVRTADDLDSLCWKMVLPYSIYYADYPEYKGVWADINHFYEVPMYFVNYVYAQALSTVLLDKILNERGFTEKYVDFLRAQFDRPAPQILKETTGLDLNDPAVLSSGFRFLEQQTEELRKLYEKMGVETN